MCVRCNNTGLIVFIMCPEDAFERLDARTPYP